MEYQLQIRLQDPPWRNTCLVGDFEHSFVIACRPGDAGEQNLVPVQAAGGVAYPPIACSDAEYVEFAVREKTLVGQAGIHLEADEIAIGWRVADAKKGGETL